MIPTDAVDRYDREAGDRPLIVLIHGTLDRAASFRRTARRLDGLDVVAYDRRGYDRSLAAGASSDMTRHVADALAVADGRRCVMVGHSFGGLIALGAAEAAPETVVAVGAYEAPAPWLVDIGDPAGWDHRDDPAEAAAAFFVEAVGQASWDRLGEPFRAARRAEGEALVADLTMAREGPSFDLDDILQPITYAVGTAGGPRYVASGRAIIDRLPHAALVPIEGPGHGAHMSHPDGFARWIVSLL